MSEITFWSAIVNPVWAIGAFILAWLCLRFLDDLSDFDFKGWLHEADSFSRAVYLGLRVLAVAILVGLIVRPPV